MKFHIGRTGEPGLCKAEISCPFGDASEHYLSKDEARVAFEALMTPIESTSEHEAERKKVHSDQFDLTIIFNEALAPFEGNEIIINNRSYAYFEQIAENEDVSESQSAPIAEFVREFTADSSMEEDGWQELKILEHRPKGAEFSKRSANIYPYNGKNWVVDYSYAEIDPNREWPYVDTEENWRKDLDRMSFLGRPERAPEPIDPRALELQKFTPGEKNTLLDKAVLEEPSTSLDGTKYRFLSVDQVRVAAVRYAIKDGKAELHSLETRSEYRNQGYMKKLIGELKNEFDGEVYSSSSFTPDGYAYTRHLTKTKADREAKVSWPDYIGENSFSFIHSWITGTPR